VEIIADLRHPHLIFMRRSAEGSGFEPELAGGMSLGELSRSDAGWFPLPLRVSLRILLDAMSGLAAVHQATQNGKTVDFVHGEVAPSNIYVGRDGIGRLVPVLPAHWNETAAPNPDVTGYIAPERLLGDVFGQPADMFSAGVLLWEAITGKPLFRNWPLDAIVTQLIGRKVPYPIPFGDALWGVPLADVAMRALAVDPGERWPHIGALGAQVENIARGHLASSDEIAALVAGFAAGRGSSIPPAVVVAVPPAPAPNAVTSLSPTAAPIPSASEPELPPASQVSPLSSQVAVAAQLAPAEPHVAGPESRSMAPVEVPAATPPPAIARWEAPPPPTSSRIWLPDTGSIAAERDAAVSASAEVADSWSGIAPPSAPGMSRRTKAVVAIAVTTSVAMAGIVAFRALERSPEARSTATVLAPKVAPANHPSTAHGATEAAKSQGEAKTSHGETPSAAAAVPSPASGPSDSVGKPSESAASANPAAAPTSIAGSGDMGTTAASLNRATPKPVTRTAPPPAPPPAAVTAAPKPAPTPAAPPPAAKPKPAPKEDLFGI